MAETTMADFFAIAEQFGTPCQPGERLDVVMARVLTEVMRRAIAQDRTISALCLQQLRGAQPVEPPAPVFTVGQRVRHIPITDEGPATFGDTWAAADCEPVPASEVRACIDEPNVPVDSVAVFIGHRTGCPGIVRKDPDGLWNGRPWAFFVRDGKRPVAVVAAVPPEPTP